MQWIKYILKGRIMSTNEKEKGMIILKSIIKKKYNMEVKCTEYKGVNCVYYEENNNMI